MLDEARTVALVREGVNDAFDGIVEHYEAPLHRYLSRLTGDREAAKDLVQKTFIDAHRGILNSTADLSLKA